MPYLSVDRVTVAYDRKPVLDAVSLEVAKGEFVALLGSSGCGKTTLLRSIAGFVPVASGHIAVDGRDLTTAPPERRDCAMVFQSYALWPHMTVAQNIGYGLKLRGWPKGRIRERVATMLALLGLDGLEARNVTRLSGGQRQRVALGRALAVDPTLLLLDEPLSNLDARIRLELRHEIKAVQRRVGITAVHVTHDREEAMIMADRIVILDRGRIAQCGTPEEVYHRPGSAFVAAFMGADNVVALDAAPDGDRLALAAGADHDAVTLPVGGTDGLHLAAGPGGPLTAHFRSEAVRVVDAGQPAAGTLVLRGRIAQTSYPGGRWRHGVAVGDRLYLVDDDRRRAVGEVVGIAVPPAALHCYPRSAAA